MSTRERFEEQKEIYRRYIQDGERNRIDGGFLISLVEAAKEVAEMDDTNYPGFWRGIDQRLKQAEEKI